MRKALKEGKERDKGLQVQENSKVKDPEVGDPGTQSSPLSALRSVDLGQMTEFL